MKRLVANGGRQWAGDLQVACCSSVGGTVGSSMGQSQSDFAVILFTPVFMTLSSSSLTWGFAIFEVIQVSEHPICCKARDPYLSSHIHSSDGLFAWNHL